MPLKDLMRKSKRFDIQSYKKHIDPKELKETHIPFTGSPQKHSIDKERVILLIEPYSNGASYYEFKIKDISYVEELPNITNIDGETITMIRIWVKKRSIGIRCSAFLVEDIKI